MALGSSPPPIRPGDAARAPAWGVAGLEPTTDLMPRTFTERGVTVPFTTPVLIQARVRAVGTQQIEFVLPNFSDGRGRYVMPWAAIRNFTVTTVHDRQLATRLQPRWAQNPVAVRELALQIAGTGLAGPAAARAARAALAHDDSFITMLKCHLVMMVAMAGGVSVQDLWATGSGTSLEENERTRSAMATLEIGLGVNRGAILDRVEKLGTLLAPVGILGLPVNGRLRQQVDRLLLVAEHCRTMAENSPPELARLALFEHEVANLTAALAIETMARIDTVFGSAAEMIRHWESRIAELTRQVLRLQHLLDGWDYVSALWEDLADRATDRNTLVTETFRLLPIIPKAELSLGEEPRIEELVGVQRRWVRAHQDWRSGRLDMTQVRRTEGLKARTLAGPAAAAAP